MIWIIFIVVCVYLFGYSLLHKIVFFVLKTYHKCRPAKTRKNAYLLPIPKLNIHFQQKSSIALIQPVYNANNRIYCDKHNIDYIHYAGNMFQTIDYSFNNSSYKYVVYMKNYMNIIDHQKEFKRIIDQAGDVELILCRDENRKDISLNVVIFRRSEWTSYKLRQLYWAKDVNNDLILDQIYTDYSRPISNNTINSGLPYRLCNICIYNEHAFNSYSSCFIQTSKLSRIVIPIYPWCKIPGYDEISSYIPPNTCCTNKIPKYIFQTMETTLLPSQMVKDMRKWIDMNPEYQYTYFTSLDCIEFLTKNFPPYVVNAYNKLLPGAYKADLWRCCVLFIHGGIYADSRVVPLIPLCDIIDESDKFIIATERILCWLWNGFMCSIPRHRVLKKIIHYICQAVHAGYYGDNTLDISGPSCVGKMMNTYLMRPENSIFSPGNKKLGVKILSLTVLSNPYLKYKGRKIIRTRAATGITEHNFRSISGIEKYGESWWNKRVYKHNLIR